MEHRAFRACLAALEIQQEAKWLAVEVTAKASFALELRVGVHVGMAQRMESVAPPGGVMLSQSTARLVEDEVTLGQPQLLRIKSFPDAPDPARPQKGGGSQ
jgi:adenylate cyclase